MKVPKKLPKGIPKKAPPKPTPFTPRPFPAARTPVKPTPATLKAAPATPKPLPFSRTPPPKDDYLTQAEEERMVYEDRVKRWRQWPLFAGGLTAFILGTYGMQLWISVNKDPPTDIPDDLIDRFDKEADGYDEKVNMAETMLMLNSKRKALMEKVHGHVLEVAVGTGRNTNYYPTKKCDTVTLLDTSKPMLAVAKRKWKDEQPEYFHRVFFKHQSALDPITPPYGAQDGYDTVIQTMGLCSTPEPVKLLQNMEAATKENGQILLLEHGKSHYQWLNNLLDKTAPAHANDHGCWWNKDIGKIVEQSGLEVVKIKRYNFGTTWWVELKPRKGIRTNNPELGDIRPIAVGEEYARVAPVSPVEVVQKPWWWLWK